MRQVLADAVAPLDAMLLKGDGDPTTRAIMTFALVLSGPPDPDRLVRAFDRASHAVPRMRQRVVHPWPSGRARWVVDRDIDVANHIHRAGPPGDASIAAVLSMAGETAGAPLDPAGPLWEATPVTGVAGGRTMVILRVHHAIADGVRALHMMANLLDLEAEPDGAMVVTLEQRGSRVQAVRSELRRKAAEAVQLQQRRADTLSGVMIDTTWRPIGLARDTVTFVRSAVRIFADVPGAPSPLLRARSRSRVCESLELPLEEMRAIAMANSATIDNVYLGGIRRNHRALDAPVQDIPIAKPLDLGKDAGTSRGNHFAATLLPGPCTVDDPGARLRTIHDLVLSRCSEPGLNIPVKLAPRFHQAPNWLVGRALKAYARQSTCKQATSSAPTSRSTSPAGGSRASEPRSR